MNRKTAAATLGVAALAALCALRRGGGAAGPDVPLYTVRRGALARRVRAEGNLKATQATPITAPGNDAMFKIGWLVEDGARVRKGDVVLRFDPTDLKRDRDAGRNAGATADRRSDKERAEGNAAVANLERDAVQAKSELDVSRTFQSKDPELYSRHEIIESDIDVELSSRKERTARATRGIREEMMQAGLDLLAIDRRKAALKIGKAERDLAQVDVKAPHDGVVVFQRDWKGDIPEVGRVVWSGLVLAEIPRVAELEAEVWVLEPDIGGLAEGRAAKVVVEARPDREIPAKVKAVDALAKPRLRGVPVQYFAVTLALATDTRTMKPGQRVVATLFPGDEKDVLAVPRQALFERDGRWIVFRRGKHGLEPAPVTLGASTAARVVVKSGLSDGDVVALADPEARPAK